MTQLKRRFLWVIISVLLAFTSGLNAQAMELNGAGATFPFPLYSEMFQRYLNAHQVQVNYQAVGSGAGIESFKRQSVDFAATDGYLKAKTLFDMDEDVLHIPTCLSAIAIVTNIGVKDLRLTPDILLDIYMGKITRWNDPRLQQVNPGTSLPAKAIVPVYRKESSGSTFIFTHYLAKISKRWKFKYGYAKLVNWPVGRSGKGSQGVASMVRRVPGSIAYIELNFARQNGLDLALIQNASGEFVRPSEDSIRRAAQSNIPDHTRVMLTHSTAKGAYPISAFTWLIVYQDQQYKYRSLATAEATADLLWWITHEGQQYVSKMGYVPLPRSVQVKAETIIRSMVYKDQAVFLK